MVTASVLLAVSWFWHFLLGTALFLVTSFLILLIMVQRGRGGGLAGALGGMGGESALGTKAGDVFTRITVGTVIIWILLCLVTAKVFNPTPDTASTPEAGVGESGAQTEADANKSDATGTDAAGTEGTETGGAGSTETPALTPETPGETPAETPSETPTETPTETPAGDGGATPSETPAETPAAPTPAAETPAGGSGN